MKILLFERPFVVIRMQRPRRRHRRACPCLGKGAGLFKPHVQPDGRCLETTRAAWRLFGLFKVAEATPTVGSGAGTKDGRPSGRVVGMEAGYGSVPAPLRSRARLEVGRRHRRRKESALRVAGRNGL